MLTYFVVIKIENVTVSNKKILKTIIIVIKSILIVVVLGVSSINLVEFTISLMLPNESLNKNNNFEKIIKKINTIYLPA
jgi:hypothetical protein